MLSEEVKDDNLDSDTKFWIDYVENVQEMVLGQGDLDLATLYQPEKLVITTNEPEFAILDHPRVMQCRPDRTSPLTATQQFLKCADYILQQQELMTRADHSKDERGQENEKVKPQKLKTVRNSRVSNKSCRADRCQQLDVNRNAIADEENDADDNQISLPKRSKRTTQQRAKIALGLYIIWMFSNTFFLNTLILSPLDRSW